jgi:hypothetical protein
MANGRISNAAAIVALDSLTDLLDVNGPGYVEIRVGAPPATLLTAASGALLGTLTLSATAFDGATDDDPGATADAAAITGDTSADADGDAGYYRGYDGNALAIIQGDITDTGTGTGDMLLDSITVTTGDTINITAWTITFPEV